MTDDAAAWERLGALLVRRRVELDRRYRNRQLFATERGIEYRLVSDIERHRRQNFEETTIAVLEAAYDLAPGSIGRALAGGELAEADGHLAHPPEDDESPDEKITLDELRRQAAELLATIDAKLAELEGPPANGGERRSA